MSTKDLFLPCSAYVIIVMAWLASAAVASSSTYSLQNSLPSSNGLVQWPTPSTFQHSHRNLQQQQDSNKFASLNENVLSTIQVSLPDATVSRSGVDLTITQLVCYNLTVQDIQIQHFPIPQNDTLHQLSINIQGVDLDCNFDWEYSWMIFNGGGTGSASTQPVGSNIDTTIDFYSNNYNEEGPNGVKISECTTELVIEDIIFDGGGVAGFAANILEELLRETIQDELGNLACTELNKLDDDGEALDGLLSMVDDRIESFMDEESDAPVVAQQSTDPLYAEKNATVPLDEDGYPMWINFLSVQDWIRELTGLDNLNDFAEQLVGGEDDGDSNGGDSINNFLRNSVLDEDGLLTIDPSVVFDDDDLVFLQMHDMFTQTTLSIQSISVKGLDTLLETNLLDPIGNYTLQNTLSMDSLTFILNMEAVIQPSSKSDAVVTSAPTEDGDSKVEESFTIEITAQDIDIRFSLFMGVNNATLGQMPLGSIIHVNNILPCALSIVDDAEVTELVVTISDVDTPRLSGFIDEGTNHLITTMADGIFSMYESVLFKAMPKFFGKTIRDLLNSYIDGGMNDEDACPEPDVLVGLMDYRDLFLPEKEAVTLKGRGGSPYGELLRGLYSLLEKILTYVDEDGLSWLNAFVVLLFDLDTNENGDIIFAGDLISQTLYLSLNGLNAVIELGVSNVTVSNIDSLGALHIAQPMNELSVLNNEATIGVGQDPLKLSFTLLVKGKGDEVDMHNEVELSISLKDVRVVLEILAQMQEQPFLNFPLEDVTNLNCWMATIVTPEVDSYGVRVGDFDTGLVLRQLSVAASEARLDMNCIYCSSTMVKEMEQTMQTQAGIEDATDVGNRIFNYATDLLGGDYIQQTIDKMLNEAAYNCPHNPSYQQNFNGIEYEEMQPVETSDAGSNGFLIAILCVVLIIASGATAIFFITRRLMRKRHIRWLSTLNQSQLLELEKMQHDEKEMLKDLNNRMTSLVKSKEVPLFMRLTIPFVILGNIALFLSGHLSLGATVNISGNFGEESFNIEGFFEFSMAKSAIEMWNAGAKALAILVGLFSGVWPYTKLLFTLFLWFSPPRWVGSKRRGSILKWLDILGKWSMVDIFVLLVTLASFNISIKSPDLSFLPDNLYSLNMLVVPLWGLYANLLAQLVAQITSHVVIHYHRKTVQAATKSQEIELGLDTPSNCEDTREKLGAHCFKLDYEASSERAIVRRSVPWILAGALLSLVILVICGCSFPSFGIEVLGLVGIAAESGNEFEQAKTLYSVFGLASMIVNQGRYLNSASDIIGLGTLASLLVITVFIVPLAQVASMFVQWFASMTKKQRLQNTIVNEVLSAWQYTEVYVLSIIIAAWQLGGVSEYMLNAYCGELEDTFANLQYFGILDEEDAQCFRVDATVEAASWILVAASLILCLVNHFISCASNQKTQDDDIPAHRRLHTDIWSHNKLEKLSVGPEVDECEETGSPMQKKILPIAPRFTDYYYIATTHQTEARDQDCVESQEDAVETAVP